MPSNEQIFIIAFSCSGSIEIKIVSNAHGTSGLSAIASSFLVSGNHPQLDQREDSMVPIKDESGRVIFEASDDIPEETAREAFKNLNHRGLLPDSKNFDEEFLDEVEKLLSE